MDWLTWFRELTDYLLTILGQEGVTLSYVIRDSKAPDYMLELQPNHKFEKLSINCVLLTGLTYNKYARKVHKLIHGFLQGETAET